MRSNCFHGGRLGTAFLVVLALALFLVVDAAQAQSTRLLRQPTISSDLLVFAYAGELWQADLDGGDARRLTSFEGVASDPAISPDGRLVAFSGRYKGQTDVYVVPIEGGTPRRLSWHPGNDIVQGWSPDGSQIVFSSNRDSAPPNYTRFWTVSLDGGMASALAIPRGHNGRFSPDGRRFVYQPIQRWQEHWRGYRGGQTHPLWILDLDDYDLTEVPWAGSIDTDPVWVDNTIYFRSDRSGGVMNVHAYDLRTGSVSQLTEHTDLDVKSLAASGQTVVYEQAGRLHRL
ncbi:MAG: protease, partial [Bacteroidota bacterium]